MELRLTKSHLTCRCESCGKENEKAIEFKFAYRGHTLNLCNDCRDELIKFLQGERECKSLDKLNAEFWVRFLCDFGLAQIVKDDSGMMSITLPIREDEQSRYREMFEKRIREAENESDQS